MDPEFPWRAIKAVVEVAGCSYLGQALIAAFAGARRHENVVYQIFKILTNPVDKAVRYVTPGFVPDRHVPFVSFGLLLWIWVFTIVMIWRLRHGL